VVEIHAQVPVPQMLAKMLQQGKPARELSARQGARSLLGR
jgi:hypothetical protein